MSDLYFIRVVHIDASPRPPMARRVFWSVHPSPSLARKATTSLEPRKLLQKLHLLLRSPKRRQQQKSRLNPLHQSPNPLPRPKRGPTFPPVTASLHPPLRKRLLWNAASHSQRSRALVLRVASFATTLKNTSQPPRRLPTSPLPHLQALFLTMLTPQSRTCARLSVLAWLNPSKNSLITTSRSTSKWTRCSNYARYSTRRWQTRTRAPS